MWQLLIVVALAAEPTKIKCKPYQNPAKLEKIDLQKIKITGSIIKS